MTTNICHSDDLLRVSITSAATNSSAPAGSTASGEVRRASAGATRLAATLMTENGSSTNPATTMVAPNP